MEENVRQQMSPTCQCVNSTIDFIDASLTLSTLIKANLSAHTQHNRRDELSEIERALRNQKSQVDVKHNT